MKELGVIELNDWKYLPKDYTGIVINSTNAKFWFKESKLHREDGPAIEFEDGEKYWYKEGKRHREDGPAYESISGYKEWWIEDKQYYQINLKDFVILEYDKGKYGIMWYTLLDKDQIIEYPDIPGLIIRNDVSGAALDSDRARDYV